MRIRRTLPVALAVVAISAAIVLAVELRKEAPPEPARLLPAADAFFYADLTWVRKASNGKPFFPVSHDSEYQRFIEQTGFDFEQDLDAVAFAVHYPQSWLAGGTGGAAPEMRFSEVLVGRFDGARCAAYFKQIAQSVESYRSVDIYSIPLGGRTLRIAILGVDTVAASNHDDPAVIRGMLDRSRRLASPFRGPAFLRRYYERVQLASPVWAVARIDPSSPQFVGWSHLFSKPADLVISASVNPLHLPLRTSVLHLRAEAWAKDDADAQAIAEKLNLMLSMFHSAEVAVGSPGSDADVKAFFDSLMVRQEDHHAVLTATLPAGFLHEVLSDAPAAVTMPSSPTEPAAAKSH
jgi:hypothetical protein